MSSPAPIRISSRTGKPVRKYTKKVQNIVKPVVPSLPLSNVVQFKDMKRHDFGKNTEHYTFKSYRITKYFTGNCQLCAFSLFNELLSKSTNLTEQLKEIGDNIKPLIFIDIKQYYVNILKSKINNDAIISESNYISSNSSLMCAIIINTKKL